MSAISIGNSNASNIWRSAMFNAMLPNPRRCVVWDQAIAAAATYSTHGIPFVASEWPSGINKHIDFVQCLLFPKTNGDTAAAALAEYEAVWDYAASTVRIFNRNKVVTGEALSVTGSGTTWTSAATKYLPTGFLAVFNSTTQLTLMRSGATQVTSKVVPNYSTGVLVTYDDTHTAGLTVDYTTNAELLSGDSLGTDAVLRMMVWGY